MSWHGKEALDRRCGNSVFAAPAKSDAFNREATIAFLISNESDEFWFLKNFCQ
jgi:hypothetical protein